MATEKPFSAQNVGKFVSDNFGLIVLGAAVFFAGFFIGSVWKENQLLSKGGLGAAAPAADAVPEVAQPLSEADWAKVQDGAYLTIGKADAPVTIVEFTDYQCPFCSRHHTDTHPQLMSEYVDKGQVKILVRDQALSFHPNANIAAQAVRCAVDQKNGVAMYNALFDNQEAWSNLSTDAAIQEFSKFATAAGMNGANLATCVENDTYKTAVEEDSALGTSVGAGGTPTFFIEGQPLVGAYPFEEFKAIIDEQLNG